MGRCVVYVWSSSMFKTGSVGHASMLIGDAGSEHYVSWWPGGDGAGPKDILNSRKVEADTYRELSEDIEEMGKRPSYTIEINHPDLDETEMIRAFWKEYAVVGSPNYSGFTGKNIYQLRSCNCSTLVARVLLAGGSAKLQKPSPKIMWTPGNVAQYAKKLAAKAAKGKENRKMKNVEDFGVPVLPPLPVSSVAGTTTKSSATGKKSTPVKLTAVDTNANRSVTATTKTKNASKTSTAPKTTTTKKPKGKSSTTSGSSKPAKASAKPSKGLFGKKKKN